MAVKVPWGESPALASLLPTGPFPALRSPVVRGSFNSPDESAAHVRGAARRRVGAGLVAPGARLAPPRRPVVGGGGDRRGAAPPTGRGGRARGRAGRRAAGTVARARAPVGAGAAAAVEHGRRRRTMRHGQPIRGEVGRSREEPRRPDCTRRGRPGRGPAGSGHRGRWCGGVRGSRFLTALSGPSAWTGRPQGRDGRAGLDPGGRCVPLFFFSLFYLYFFLCLPSRGAGLGARRHPVHTDSGKVKGARGCCCCCRRRPLRLPATGLAKAENPQLVAGLNLSQVMGAEVVPAPYSPNTPTPGPGTSGALLRRTGISEG